MGRRDRIRGAMNTRLGIDTRALAAFRIALGLVLIVDLLLRFRDLRAFYTDSGVLPRSTLTELYPTFARVSPYAISGEAWAILLLFMIAGVAAAALTVGYRTRIATAVSLALLLSIQARNPLVLNAGDTLLWQLLALGFLCPLSNRWSVDAVRRDISTGTSSHSAGDRLTGPVSALLLSFVVLLYLSNGLVKLRGTTWPDGTAVSQVFQLDYLYGPFGHVLGEFPALLTMATYGWQGFLLAAPLLLVFSGRLRAALAGTFVAAHLSMVFVLQIGVFPLVSIAGLIPFFPASVWDHIDRVVEPASARLRRIATRGSNGGSPDHQSVAETEGERSMSIGNIARLTPMVVAAVLLVSLIAWNGMALSVVSTPEPVSNAVDPSENRWDMFAPNPPDTSKLYLTTIVTVDGERFDALHGDAIAGERSPTDARAYPTDRWRKYLVGLTVDAEDDRDERLAAYLCGRGGEFTDGRIDRVEVTSVLNDVTATGASSDLRTFDVATREC